ncbi:hypothetical protein HAX54_025227, partial [Datura stramonium]|nr:hypothetical protein [Datura stramonium]
YNTACDKITHYEEIGFGGRNATSKTYIAVKERNDIKMEKRCRSKNDIWICGS